MHGARVLVVDDSVPNLDLASYLLDEAGFQVATAADAQSARRALDAVMPDIVLMDIQLPGQDGLELTRALKADARTRHIPVIAFTAYAMKGDEAIFRSAGCDGYLAKPIDVARFAEQVRALIG